MRNPKFIRVILSCLVILLSVSSCTSAFPNGKLDYMWRLDKITYLKGHDYFGNECTEEEKGRIWYSFARDLVEIRDNQPYGKIGITTDYGDSIKFDFSMYESIPELHSCGIWDSITTFKIELLNSREMILSDLNVRLSFTRW